MKALSKLFNALTVISMVSLGVGFVIAIWFNALIGLKVVTTSFVSMSVCMLVAMGLDVY